MISYTVEISLPSLPASDRFKLSFDTLVEAMEYARHYKREQGTGEEMCYIRREDVIILDSFRV